MKSLAKYLQIALLAYFLVFLLFFIFFDSLGSMFGMDPITSTSMVKVFLTGLIVFLASWAALAFHMSSLNDKIKKMEQEMNGVKAKLYDLEHPKTVTPPASKPIPQKNQEDTSGTIRPRQNFTDQ
jgi:hypothetical protein